MFFSMLDIKFIRENPDIVRQAAENKGVDIDVDKVLALDKEYRALLTENEELRKQHNEASKARDVEKGKELKGALAEREQKIDDVKGRLDPLLRGLPNIPSEDTPIGQDESGNVVTKTVGQLPDFGFEPKDHTELGKMHDLIDSELSAQVSGARFTYLKGDLVLLQNAVIQHVIATLTNEDTLKGIIADNGLDVSSTPFIPVIPPLFIRAEVMERMARLEPREERYHIPSDDLYLIGSAEHTLGPMHMDQTFKEADLPKRYFACTPAFRREAGSYGKDTKGILRLHQFDKIEMESFSLPEHSRAEQDLFVAIQEHIVQDLGLPYQVVQICTGDMGGPDSRQIDIETWMPGQGKYRETHTSDLMTDYQARRLKTRVKRNDGTIDFVHMNDATAVALGRILIALLENNQQQDGSIRIPELLIPFMGGKAIIGK